MLRFPLALSLCLLITWQLLRAVLWFRFAPSGLSTAESLRIFGTGFLADAAISVAGAALIIGLCSFLSSVLALPSLLLLPLGFRPWIPVRRALFRIAVTVGLMVTIFLWISEWYFFAEFESRFNTVAIDYLIYPHEVFTNLRESYPLPWIGLACLIGGAGLAVLLFRRTPPPPGIPYVPSPVGPSLRPGVWWPQSECCTTNFNPYLPTDNVWCPSCPPTDGPPPCERPGPAA